MMSNHYLKMTLALLCSGATIGGKAWADHDTKPTQLPTLTITGEADTAPQALTVPNIETAREQINRVPGGVDIIDAESYQKGRAANLKDVLDYSPGVYVQPRFGAEESRVSIRGSGIQRTFHGRGIKLLQDGVPLNLADGGFDMQAVEPLAAEYVEVYRGANALMYGSTTLGGAINFVSRAGYTASPLQLRFESGSFDTYRAQVSSGQVIGDADYYISGTFFSTNGFRNWSEQENERIFSNFGYRFNENLETRFYVTYVNTQSNLPGSLTKAQLEDDPTQANPSSLRGQQKRDFRLMRLGNTTTWRWDDKQRIDISSFWSYKDLYHPIFQVLDQVSDDYGMNIRYTNENDLFGRKNIFILGLYPTGGRTQDDRFVNVGGHRGARRAKSTQDAINIDLYGENQHYILHQLALVTGLQLSYASREYTDRFLSNGDQSDHQDFFGVSPKIGARWEFTANSQAYVNFSRSFEPPSFGELTLQYGNTPLQLSAQRGSTVEIGTRGQEGMVNWDLSYYHAWIENELLQLRDPADPSGTATITRNADSTTIHQGIELGFEVRPIENIVLRQAYMWNDFRFDNDPTYGNNRLPGIPEHYLRAELRYEHPSGFYAGPNVEWSATRIPVDLANTLSADAYAIMGFRAGYRTKQGFSAYFEAKNLTDEKYAATTGVIANADGRDAAQFYPGDGRAFFGGVEYRF
ncbi:MULTISPECIES: TonB-dependent receptor domain-containing protein [Methylocaldum]|jgi:iron complex outermembrane receptor protein|uniref:TonB-dependent receptor family protein n=1 Tax=Methylocaldum sp. GT1TLB TaxID=3438965 RepID=UPI003DA0DA69